MISELSSGQWLELLKTKSILRQRSREILTVITFNLANNHKDLFRIEDIQQCLLSFGVLNYYDEQLLKRLMNDLSELIKNGLKLTSENETLLESIMSSIGILRLRDEALLDLISDFLENANASTNLVTNFIISCAYLNYRPKIKFDSLINSLKYDEINDKSKLINLTWSLCVLNKPNLRLIDICLNEPFYKELAQEPIKKEMVLDILKLFQINLYSLVCINDYNGSYLPPDFNISLIEGQLVKKPTSVFTTLISTISSFASKDKLFKSNLLMPFGLLVDVFLIMDKNGNIKPLEQFYNKENEEYQVDNKKHFKVAIKLIDYKMTTLLNEKIDGINKMQIKLLNCLDYITIPVSKISFKPIKISLFKFLLEVKIVSHHPNRSIRKN